jgi:hypothetical protein
MNGEIPGLHTALKAVNQGTALVTGTLTLHPISFARRDISSAFSTSIDTSGTRSTTGLELGSKQGHDTHEPPAVSR